MLLDVNLMSEDTDSHPFFPLNIYLPTPFGYHLYLYRQCLKTKNLTVTFSTSVSYTLVKPMAKPNRNKRRKEAKQKECFIVLFCKRTWRRTIMFRSEMDTSHQDAHNGDQTLMPKLLWIFNTLWF